MYLLIFEDGDVGVTDIINEETYNSADDGYVDIIRLDKDGPKRYQGGKWHQVENID